MDYYLMIAARLELCILDGRLVPCVDFGHLYACTLGALLEGEAPL